MRHTRPWIGTDCGLGPLWSTELWLFRKVLSGIAKGSVDRRCRPVCLKLLPQSNVLSRHMGTQAGYEANLGGGFALLGQLYHSLIVVDIAVHVLRRMLNLPGDL